MLCVNELVDHAVRATRGRPRYAYIAPLYRQAKQVAWDYLKHYTEAIPDRKANETELRVDLPNGARIQLYGADNPDSLRGIYLDGVVLDEYAQMSPHLWGEVRTMPHPTRWARAWQTPGRIGNELEDVGRLVLVTDPARVRRVIHRLRDLEFDYKARKISWRPPGFPPISAIRNKHETVPSRHTKFTEYCLSSTGRNVQSSAHVKRNPRLLAPCLLGVFCLGAGCQTMTEYVVPHPRHAEKSVHEAVTEVFDGLARTERDLKRILNGDGLEDKGRLFLHVGGSGIGSELALYLHQGMSHILQDAGYEIVSFEELEKKIRRRVSGDVLSCDRRIGHAAARALKVYDGVGALDICVTSVSSLGLGELNNEGEYEQRLRMGVTTKLLEAKWGDELFRDRVTLTSRTVLKQAERHYSEKVRGMSLRERSMYRLLLDHVRTLLPRLPERRR